MADKKKINSLAAKNLAQIQKIDPCANLLLDKVIHTALYKFTQKTRRWEKEDVEGTMFIYQRVDKPVFRYSLQFCLFMTNFSLMIANQQSPNDYIEPILPTLKFALDEKKNFMFFSKQDASNNGTISGLWFYNSDDAVRIIQLIGALQEKLRAQGDKQESKASTDARSMQLLELIRGKAATSPASSSENTSTLQAEARATDLPSPASDSRQQPPNSTPTSSRAPKSVSSEPSSKQSLPPMLQKLLIQEQPHQVLRDPGTQISSDVLEKDLINTAKPKNARVLDFINSPSGISLNALSTRSMHGSDGDNDIPETEVADQQLDTSFVVGSGESTPLLDKNQFVLAMYHLMQTDEQFVTQIHQAYVDALGRRLGQQ